MQNIQLSYSLDPKAQPRGRIHNPLMALLHAVQEHGSISAAAKALQLSYRHVWGQLKRWEAELDENLTTEQRVARLQEIMRRRMAEKNGEGHPG